MSKEAGPTFVHRGGSALNLQGTPSSQLGSCNGTQILHSSAAARRSATAPYRAKPTASPSLRLFRSKILVDVAWALAGGKRTMTDLTSLRHGRGARTGTSDTGDACLRR